MATIRELGSQLGEEVKFGGTKVQIVGLVPEGNGREAAVTYVHPPLGGRAAWNLVKYWPKTGEIEHQPVTRLGTRIEDRIRLQGVPTPGVEPIYWGEEYVQAQMVHGGYRGFERVRARSSRRATTFTG